MTGRLLRGSAVLLFLAAFAFPLWGELFYPDDPELLALVHISHRMKKTLPFSTFPVHGSDILGFADKLLASAAADSLNDADHAILEDLVHKLEKQRQGEIAIKGGLAASYEHRFSTRDFSIEDEELPNAEDVRRVFLNFSPVLSLSAAGGTFNGIWLASCIDLRPSWEDDFFPMNNFFTKVNITYDFVNKGVLAWNGNYINLSLGRDMVHWGNPKGATLYPSKLLPHMDNLSMNIPLGPLTFDYMLASIMPKRSHFRDVDNAIQQNYPLTAPDTSLGEDPLGPHFGFMKDPFSNNPSIIMMASHRLQWNFGRVKIGAGGTIVYARANNQFLFTDFLPLIIYHNSDSVPNNLALVVDAQWTIAPGLNLSVMAGFDDIAGSAIGIPDGEIPTIPGAILQLEYSMARPKIFQSYMFEAGYTHYLWGNFAYDDKPDSWYGVYLARAIYRYTPNKSAILLPLTSPYGPGSLWGKLNADLLFPALNIHAGAEFLFLAKNSEVNLIDPRYETNNGYEGFNRFFFILDLPCSYTWRWFDFYITPTIFWGSGGAAFECTLGVRFSMEGKRFFSSNGKYFSQRHGDTEKN